MSVRSVSAQPGWITVLGIVAVLVMTTASFVGCGSEHDISESEPDAGGGDLVDGGGADDSGGYTPDHEPDASVVDAGIDPCADASPDAEIDCTGRCGPVQDPCTGVVKQCGGCADLVLPDGTEGGPQVCDLVTNTCTTPKVTCADLDAECGVAKNSCGEYLDCPDGLPKGCPEGKECDPNTNKCRDCQDVTCQDLGYECGVAWLGCGEDTPANYVDCGSCADAPGGTPRTCNDVFRTCEPVGTPKSASELCEAAKAKSGLECGIISDGHGGTVNCDSIPGFGCKAGESCGVRGIANRCDAKATPDECKALGKNCGEITSVCTGEKIQCGDCTGGEVCNPNGVCGPPCAPKTCADDFATFACGTFDDGCGGTVTCGTCPGGVCDQATNTCCTLKTAAEYRAADECGTNLTNGCGGKLTVACTGGKFCVSKTKPGAAPASGEIGTCCTNAGGSCAPGADGQHCGPASVPNTCLTGQSATCNRCAAGLSCGPNGKCCPPACTAQGREGDDCGMTKTNACGEQAACGCGPGLKCFNGKCTKLLTCSNYPGQCGTGLSDGAGGTINCGCSSGRTCSATGPGQTGVCNCTGTGTPTPYTCATIQPPLSAGQCGSFPDGCGGSISCTTCSAGQSCNTKTKSCCTPNSCPTSQPAGATCGGLDNGCGGTMDCTSSCAPGLTCHGSKCCQPTFTCDATPTVGSTCGSNISNGCGTTSCSCGTSGLKCHNGKCCEPKTTCDAAQQCGTISNGCGGTISCGSCPSGAGNENFTCKGNTCECVPDTCRGRTGPQPDRCGGTLQCTG